MLRKGFTGSLWVIVHGLCGTVAVRSGRDGAVIVA
ncbi:hypothetical protein CLV37_11464 [Kineococcus rhizosphaerae]|uniref:Uncharacterized protein n=1 Tax=Kineococcus rhizosphaerae TaxID=559628 RepID=A0A2T0QY18_9ACTN|nr:hypothetical protein CLV37_11464 [Kineococcus rhizosphaerae]